MDGKSLSGFEYSNEVKSCGYWCESGDIAGFNQKVQQLCDPALRKQMGLAARQYLEDNYTTKHTYEIIMKHFEEGI